MSVPCTELYIPICIFLSMWSGFQMRRPLETRPVHVGRSGSVRSSPGHGTRRSPTRSRGRAVTVGGCQVQIDSDAIAGARSSHPGSYRASDPIHPGPQIRVTLDRTGPRIRVILPVDLRSESPWIVPGLGSESPGPSDSRA